MAPIGLGVKAMCQQKQSNTSYYHNWCAALQDQLLHFEFPSKDRSHSACVEIEVVVLTILNRNTNSSV